ncbi:MAG: sulfotransferase family 2 domain-containing protein [Promethearchaeota archaeon]
MIYFCHMIKTGGMTLHNIFRNNYGFNYVRTEKDNFNQDDLKILLKINKNIKAISGHSLRLHKGIYQICPRIKVITFFRNPLDRFISHYNHGKIRSKHNISFEDFVKIRYEMNYQTKFIIGARNSKERDYKAGVREFELAKKILIENFSFVGILEKFDESLLLMNRILNLKNFNLRYRKMNVAPRKSINRLKIPDHLMREMNNNNKIDNMLYHFVNKELFEEQKRKYGTGLNEDLDEFRLDIKKYEFNKLRICKSRIGQYVFYDPILKLHSYFNIKQYNRKS